MALQNQLTIEQLQTILSQTLSPDAETRKAGEFSCHDKQIMLRYIAP
jgi:hypothetical protein